MSESTIHTSREFERELTTLRDRLLHMGGRAEQQIARAVESIIRSDAAAAARVIADDEQIDHDEVEIDELAVFILARRQPVASDLRFIITAVKIVTDLERIGDLAVNIAKRQKDLSTAETSSVLPQVSALARMTSEALRRALDAFVRGDAEQAEDVIRNDGQIDELNTRIITTLLAEHGVGSNLVARSLALSSVSRYLERIGDHATNIAEMVIYGVRGRDVRHTHRPASPKSSP